MAGKAHRPITNTHVLLKGVRLRVNGASGVSTTTESQIGFAKPEDKFVIQTTNLGEVEIVLEKRGSAPIALSINGKSYPAKARNVVVNEY